MQRRIRIIEMQRLLDAAFDLAWSKAASAGLADELGGAEYRRVFAEWIGAGRPRTVALFIALEANRAPSPKEGEP